MGNRREWQRVDEEEIILEEQSLAVSSNGLHVAITAGHGDYYEQSAVLDKEQVSALVDVLTDFVEKGQINTGAFPQQEEEKVAPIDRSALSLAQRNQIDNAHWMMNRIEDAMFSAPSNAHPGSEDVREKERRETMSNTNNKDRATRRTYEVTGWVLHPSPTDRVVLDDKGLAITDVRYGMLMTKVKHTIEVDPEMLKEFGKFPE